MTKSHCLQHSIKLGRKLMPDLGCVSAKYWWLLAQFGSPESSDQICSNKNVVGFPLTPQHISGRAVKSKKCARTKAPKAPKSVWFLCNLCLIPLPWVRKCPDHDFKKIKIVSSKLNFLWSFIALMYPYRAHRLNFLSNQGDNGHLQRSAKVFVRGLVKFVPGS